MRPLLLLLLPATQSSRRSKPTLATVSTNTWATAISSVRSMRLATAWKSAARRSMSSAGTVPGPPARWRHSASTSRVNASGVSSRTSGISRAPGFCVGSLS